MNIDISVDIAPLIRRVDKCKAELPFATALALTRLAQGARDAEKGSMEKRFEHPTPFTENSVSIVTASKQSLTARVFVKKISAAYLDPYVFGGDRFLGKKDVMLVPENIAVNQYGNLPRNKLKQLKGQPNVFIGPVKLKSGKMLTGVWQRTGPRSTPKGVKTGKRSKIAMPTNRGLKLLIAFDPTTPAPFHWDFEGVAEAYVRKNARAEFLKALRHAVTTAKKA